MALIALEQLAHSYLADPQSESSFALKEVNLTLENGCAYALLGPSGCGKTTLLNIVSGLLRPTRGRVLFDGCDVTSTSTTERNIAQVFQFPVVYDTMTVGDNLAFPLRNQGKDKSYVSNRVNMVAKMIGLEAHLEKKARGLTADLKQKISLGRGVVRADVNAIMLDEPLTVIDPHLKWELRTQLKSLHREFGHTMIYVTHDQTEALTFAEKVVVMHEGSVVQIGTPQELFDTPAHTFVGHFVGSPGMNFLKVSIEGRHAILNGKAIDLEQDYGVLAGETMLGIRPEFARLSKNEGLPINITRIQDAGRRKFVKASVFGSEIDIVLDAETAIETDMTKVMFDTDKISIFNNDWRIAAQTSATAKGRTC